MLPPRVRGQSFTWCSPPRTIRSFWIQVRCIVLSYRPLSVGSTRRWPATYSHSLHVIAALERTILHPVLSYRPPWVGSTCVQDIHYDEIRWDWLWAIVQPCWSHGGHDIVYDEFIDELMAWFGICWIRWHIHELMAYYSLCMIYWHISMMMFFRWEKYMFIYYIFSGKVYRYYGEGLER